MSDRNTRDRLLDAAEALIAQQGHANTSLREITAKAGANIAAVNYHFGSKEKLTSQMLTRRIAPLNEERRILLEAELAAADSENRPPDTETLVRAFIEPAITFFYHKAGGKHFLRLFSRIHADPDDTIRQEFLKHMLPLFLTFLEAFKKSLPKIAVEQLTVRFFFLIGAMGHGAGLLVDEGLRQKGPELGIPLPSDSKLIVEQLVAFVVRGMEAK